MRKTCFEEIGQDYTVDLKGTFDKTPLRINVEIDSKDHNFITLR
jgi:hypothetical protein